jgi:hypothetical protein
MSPPSPPVPPEPSFMSIPCQCIDESAAYPLAASLPGATLPASYYGMPILAKPSSPLLFYFIRAGNGCGNFWQWQLPRTGERGGLDAPDQSSGMPSTYCVQVRAESACECHTSYYPLQESRSLRQYCVLLLSTEPGSLRRSDSRLRHMPAFFLFHRAAARPAPPSDREL